MPCLWLSSVGDLLPEAGHYFRDDLVVRRALTDPLEHLEFPRADLTHERETVSAETRSEATVFAAASAATHPRGSRGTGGFASASGAR